MLQQTQVSRVLAKFEEWLLRFPDWKALAAASNAEVILAWEGLGYNRRALMLRDIARHVVEEGVPQNREEWLALKGIGPYTSAALACFSLGERVLPIDTNVRRTLGRMLLGELFPGSEIDQTIEKAGKELMAGEGYRDVPQALFDLANGPCRKMPDCASCPMAEVCASSQAFLKGDVITPKRTVKKGKERIHRDKPFPDRIYRGRIVQLVRKSEKGVEGDGLGTLIDPDFTEALDSDWLEHILHRLERDRMISWVDGRIVLHREGLTQ